MKKQAPTPTPKTRPKAKARASAADQYMDVARQRTFAAKASKSMTKSNVPAMRSAAGDKSLRKLEASVKEASSFRLNGRLEAFFRTLGDPWGPVVKSPINYNPVPSFVTSSARVTCNRTEVVAATSNHQIDLLPGHGGPDNDSEMDGVSYHAHPQQIGASTNYSIAPMGDGTLQAAIGIITENAGVDTSSTASGTANSSAMVPDVALPFQSSDGDGKHSRWKLVSQGIRIENVTPMATRGGYTASVQLPAGYSSSTIKDHARFPTYLESVDANDGTLILSWVPNAEDMAFWHSDSSSAYSNLLAGGLRVFLVNDTSGAQTYRISVVQNYELAGSSLVSVGTSSVHQPADKSIVEPALAVVKSSLPDARHLPRIATAVAHTVSPFANALGKHMTTALASVPKAASDLVKGLFMG